VTSPTITLSVVSHGQNALVNGLLVDLRERCLGRVALIVTLNISDPVALDLAAWPGPVEVTVNATPKGFGANHNAAFQTSQTRYFCVCNPDVRLPSNPFDVLLDILASDRAGVAGPLVRSPVGVVEDSARRFPTLPRLLRKALLPPHGPDYPIDQGPVDVDWIAGMFMLFDCAVFRSVGGFDERYFLYYEDVDICRALHAIGRRVIYDPRAGIVHDARRASRRDLRRARHHIASAVRFLFGRRQSRPHRRHEQRL